jgi:osmotically-inducible protein OsmY
MEKFSQVNNVVMDYHGNGNGDSFLLQAALDGLRSTGIYDLKYTKVHVEKGVVILRGTVCSWYLKQCAQEVILHLEGVNEVKNDIKVKILNAVSPY